MPLMVATFRRRSSLWPNIYIHGHIFIIIWLYMRIYTLTYVFWMSGHVFFVSGLVFWVSGLVFVRLNLYLGV